jgi:hypothetical protein
MKEKEKEKEKEKKSPLADAYPNVAEFIFSQGCIELGYEPNTRTYARAIDEGGTVWDGGKSNMTLEELLEVMEAGLEEADIL